MPDDAGSALGPWVVSIAERIGRDLSKCDLRAIRAHADRGRAADALAALCDALRLRGAAVTMPIASELGQVSRALGLDARAWRDLPTRARTLRENSAVANLVACFERFLRGDWDLSGVWSNLHGAAARPDRDLPERVREHIASLEGAVSRIRSESRDPGEQRAEVARLFAALEKTLDEAAPHYADPDWPEWRAPAVEDERAITLLVRDGTRQHAVLTIYEPHRDPLASDRCRVSLSSGHTRVTAGAADYFGALIALRRQLEAHGLLVECYGASRWVWASGMQRDMGMGRVAYRLDRHQRGSRPPEVHVFDTGPDVEAVTVDEQREYVAHVFGTLPKV